MGRLKVDCLAVNHNSTIIYGLALASQGDRVYSRESAWVVLIRTLPYPTSFEDIQWEVVSATQATRFPYYWYPEFGSIDCAVSPSGVFTALVKSRSNNNNDPPVGGWQGINFDPNKANTNDSWRKFDVPKDYNMPLFHFTSRDAIYVQQPIPGSNTTFKETFLHVVTGWQEETSDYIIRLGSFELGKGSIPDSTTVTNWLTPANSTLAALDNDYLHVHQSLGMSLTTLPLTNLAGPIPESTKVSAQLGVELHNIVSGTSKNVPFLVCFGRNSADMELFYFIYNYRTPATSTTSPVYTVFANYMPDTTTHNRQFQFLNIQYPNSPKEFMLAVTVSSLGHILGFNLGNSTGYNIGTFFVQQGVSVNDPYTSPSSPYPGKGTNPSRKPNENSNSVAPQTLGGIVAAIGAVFLILFIGYKVWNQRRNRRLRKNTNGGIESASHPMSDSVGSARQSDHEQQQQQQSSHNLYQPSARHDGSDAPPPYQP
ncbi:hypothetical protein FBU30_009518 [Linnemannia zychae]|nr:hypothetical protein FBU30_009518 [Linnemannia zychae]